MKRYSILLTLSCSLAVNAFSIFPLPFFGNRAKLTTPPATESRQAVSWSISPSSLPNYQNDAELLVYDSFIFFEGQPLTLCRNVKKGMFPVSSNWEISDGTPFGSCKIPDGVYEMPIAIVPKLPVIIGERPVTLFYRNYPEEFKKSTMEFFCTLCSNGIIGFPDRTNGVESIGTICKVIETREIDSNWTVANLQPVRRAKAHGFTSTRSYPTMLVEDLDRPLQASDFSTEEALADLVGGEKVCTQLYKDICTYSRYTALQFVDAMRKLPPEHNATDPFAGLSGGVIDKLLTARVSGGKPLWPELFHNRPLQAVFATIHGVLARLRELSRRLPEFTLPDPALPHWREHILRQTLALSRSVEAQDALEDDIMRDHANVTAALEQMATEAELPPSDKQALLEAARRLRTNLLLYTSRANAMLQLLGDCVPQPVEDSFVTACGHAANVTLADLHSRQVRFSLAACAIHLPNEGERKQETLQINELFPRLRHLTNTLADFKRQRMLGCVRDHLLTLEDVAGLEALPLGEDWMLYSPLTPPDSLMNIDGDLLNQMTAIVGSGVVCPMPLQPTFLFKHDLPSNKPPVNRF